MDAELSALYDKLISWRNLYYADGESPVTDDEYDAVKSHLESNGVEVSNLAPPPKGTDWAVVEHRHHMPSMPRCATTLDELKSHCSDLESDWGYSSLKYDGLSIELQYKDRILTHAVLRGDGNRGEDVIANARMMSGVPKTIPLDGFVEVYGEVVISQNNLQLLNEYRDLDNLRAYKSPRNAVAMIRSKKLPSAWAALMVVRSFGLGVNGKKHDSLFSVASLDSMNQVMTGPAINKFQPAVVNKQTITEAWASRNEAAEKRNKLKYQVDGTVFQTPNGSIKIKFDPESAVTTVRGIVEQLGLTGIVTPVIEFDPVKLIGADVVRATGHNTTLMRERLHGLGVGAKVLVSRRGDVIPHVEQVVESAEIHWEPSDSCPSCGATIEQDGSARRCSADPSECPGTSVGLLLKFIREMNIDGIGPATAMAIMGSGLVQTPADLYSLDPVMLSTVWMGNGDMGMKTANKIIDNIASSTRVTWGDLLGSLGIPGCAKSVMRVVAAEYPDPDDLKEVSRYRLSMLDGIGPKRAMVIKAYIDTSWDDIIKPLIDAVYIIEPTKQLNGKTFCITLGLRSCGRPEMEARIRQCGGDVKSSVSRYVTHLVCNQPDAGTSKLKRAAQLGVPVISEEELIMMMGTEIPEVEINENEEF